MEKARSTSDLFVYDRNKYPLLDNLMKQAFFLIATFYFLLNNIEQMFATPPNP